MHSGGHEEIITTPMANSTLLLNMLQSCKLTCQDKDFLHRFCEVGANRTKKIFDSKPHRDRLLATVRNAAPTLWERDNDFGERISSLEALFEDILGDVPGKVQVCMVMYVSHYSVHHIYSNLFSTTRSL